MSPRHGYYPPSHRRTDAPQPEVCDVTGFPVEGGDLMTSDARGLEGRRVSSASPFLAHARMSPPELHEIMVPEIIGQERVYEPGDESWFSQGPPNQAWFTPQALETLALWLRNDDIPASGSVASWLAAGGLGLPSASQSTLTARPSVVADPFGTDCRGIRFGSSTFLTLSATATLAGSSTPFLFAAAFRSPAVLVQHALLAGLGGASALQIEADGSVTVVGSGGGSNTVAAAGTILGDVSYTLVVLRSGSDLICRVNGVDESAGATYSGSLAFTRVGTPVGAAYDVAELIAATGTDYSGDSALLRQLERYLGFLVGVEL